MDTKYLGCQVTLINWASPGYPGNKFHKLCMTEFKIMYFSKTIFLLCKIIFLFSCPPRVFLPALCRVFLDESAPENVLEVTARAITYYLDVSAECTRRIVAVEGAVKMLCNRLVAVDLQSRTSKDLAEQCVKVCHNFNPA